MVSRRALGAPLLVNDHSGIGITGLFYGNHSKWPYWDELGGTSRDGPGALATTVKGDDPVLDFVTAKAISPSPTFGRKTVSNTTRMPRPATPQLPATNPYFHISDEEGSTMADQEGLRNRDAGPHGQNVQSPTSLVRTPQIPIV